MKEFPILVHPVVVRRLRAEIARLRAREAKYKRVLSELSMADIAPAVGADPRQTELDFGAAS